MPARKKRKALQATRPSRRIKAEAKMLAREKPARLSMELPQETHRALKIQAASSGLSIKEYVLDLLKKDGLPVP